MKRKIITIDGDKCNGCGQCVPNCPEGALQMIDGKARLVSDLFCDGLGACIGHCPEGAITIEEREAVPYDEDRVMENIVKQGTNTILAHLRHLKEHGETEYLEQAVRFLGAKGFVVPGEYEAKRPVPLATAMSGCPGSRTMDFRKEPPPGPRESGEVKLSSGLRQWPVQLQLLNPEAPYLKGADLLIAADCVPFAYADFHRKFLADRVLVIFCPKLDGTMEEYLDKLAHIFGRQDIRSITLVHMEVPCCFGVNRLVEAAMEKAGRRIPVKEYTISIRGEILKEG